MVLIIGMKKLEVKGQVALPHHTLEASFFLFLLSISDSIFCFIGVKEKIEAAYKQVSTCACTCVCVCVCVCVTDETQGPGRRRKNLYQVAQSYGKVAHHGG